MQEVLDLVYGYVRGIWRRRWVIAIVAWLVCLVGWVVVLQMPDQYRSSARVHVDTQSMLRPLLRGLAADTNIGGEVAFITRTLLSRANLEKVARMTDLDLQAKTPEELDSLLNSLRGRISFSGERDGKVYNIGFSDQDPELARRVVQAVLTLFVESSLGSTRKDTDSAQRFLDEQIAEYEARLIESENRLKEFKQQNVGLMSRSGGDYYAQMQRVMSQLKEAEFQLREAAERRDELMEQLQDAEDDLEDGLLFSPGGSGVSTPMDGRIQNLEAQLDGLLLKYTDKHPDVVSLRQQLKVLKAERDQQMVTAVENDTGIATNPVIQQLKISLGEAEALVSSSKVRVSEYKQRIEYLDKMVDTIPEVEAALKNLNRDYGIIKSSYEQLLSRRESARMAQQADETGDGVKFSVIEPPRVPREPTGPNRQLYMVMTLGGGLGAGIVLAFLLSQLRSTFDDRGSLRNATGFPVLGTLSMEWTPTQRLRMRVETIVFTASILLLLVAYGGVSLFEAQGVALMAKLS